MLIKLLPENITKNWDTIKYAIEHSLPPMAGEGIDKMNRIFEALLAGSLECWAAYRYEESGVKIFGIATTQLLYEPNSDVYNLLIYSTYSFRLVSEEEWLDSYNTLAEYARSLNCKGLIAYTKEARVLEIVEKIGGTAETRFLSLPI